MVSAPLVQLALPAWWWVRIRGPGLAWGWDVLPPWGDWAPPCPVWWSRCAPLGVVWFGSPHWHLSRATPGYFGHCVPAGVRTYDLSTLQYKSAKMPLKRPPPPIIPRCLVCELQTHMEITQNNPSIRTDQNRHTCTHCTLATWVVGCGWLEPLRGWKLH